ncbi:uncharacterized protein SCHCODRAFT_02629875 [Schizophyllum commune H4-8]|nr:uncharacterized protein SCHCODRAFT_02629875 [Schizophyllum commune H4-8]KAI5891718.1 hypothetical protein SCHCODRAFT_02629875 [Schizophyllum commune H4-8]
MASQELADLLLLARETGLLENPPALLSRILHVLCRERSQPLDPDFVSEPACRRRLSEHPEILPLLETAVKTGNQGGLWDDPHLSSEDLDLVLLRELAKADAAIWKNVEDLLSESYEKLSELATGASFAEVWCPSTSSREDEPKVVDAYGDFIRTLHIPKASDNFPCLLLHELGSLIDEKHLLDRTNQIFAPDTHTIFINSSGSGKTRLLLEGLCRHWGVYMTCAVDPSGVGCADFPYTLSVGLQKKPYFKGLGELRERDITRNCYIAQDVFAVPFLSRLLLLSRFLEAVPTAERNTDETRKRWLHLQVLARFVGCDGLLFELTRSLAALPASAVQSSISDTLLKIRALLGIRDLPIYCALDECQVASQKYPGAFGDESTTLHQMALSWQSYEHVSVILTGTAADVRPFVDAAHPPYRIYTDTGAFDTPDDQARYVMHYMPSAVVSSDEGKDLISRMWLWLRGRHRFTAAFIACLLMTQFQQPHELLDAYIAANLRVHPIDRTANSGHGLSNRASRELVKEFNYFTGQSLLYDAQSYFSAHYAIHQILLGHTPVALTENCFPLAAHGLAYFTDATGTEVRVHEPTVLCPLLQPNFYESGVVNGFFPDVMGARLREVPTHNSIRLALASLFLHAFKDGPRPLTDLFLFPVATPDWVAQTADLVCVTRCTTRCRSSYSEAKPEDVWITDSPSWLQHQREEPFCDASKFSGADLLFVLRLKNQKCLHVAVAVMLRNDHVDVSPADIERKLHDLAPSNIFSQDARATTTGSLSFPHLRVKALAAGDPPVLRVVTTFPHEMEMDINLARRDEYAQPIATINMTTMREVAESISPDDVGRRLMAVLTRSGGKKRKYADDEETHRPKRMTTRLSEKKESGNRQGTVERRPEAPTERPTRDTTKRKAQEKGKGTTRKGPTPKETKKTAASQTQETRRSSRLASRG